MTLLPFPFTNKAVRRQFRGAALLGVLLSITVTVEGQPAAVVEASKPPAVPASNTAAQHQQLEKAAALLDAGKTEEALVLFEEIFHSFPDTPQSGEMRTFALNGYVTAGTLRAGELAASGDIAGARAILDKLDSREIALGHKEVAKLRRRLSDPDRFPPALTAEHVKRVNEVKRLLVLANSQREIGDFDKATLTFQEVLRLDPYNSAARRGMETVEQDRSRYFEAAKDHRRASMLNEIEKLWEDPVPAKSSDISGLFGNPQQPGGAGPRRGGREAIIAKMRDWRIERIDFTGATLQEVVEYLRVRSRDLDPEKRGIDFVIGLAPEANSRLISLNLINVPIEEVLRYVGEIAGVRYRVEDFAVRLVSLTEDSGSIISKSYRVPPDFISTSAVGAAPGAPADPFSATASTAPTGLNIRRLGAQEYLQSQGVTFPEGTGASYSTSTNILIVRNNPKNIELVDMLVDQALNSSPKQVVVEVRALEVGQNRLQELGFDWLLGGFNASNTQLAGGTIGNQQSPNFVGLNFPNAAGGVPIGANPVTAGLRSSGDLIGTQSIEDVLYGAVTPTTTRSPGVFSLSGVLSDPQFQTVVRALDQKTGVDLLVKPSVVTKSGQKATVQVVRELLYPTEFDPPQIPTNVGTLPPVVIIGVPYFTPPTVVTPATPTAFEMRRVGVVLDVEPVIAEDGRSVDLTITPEVTDFVGFVNYGSPIRSVSEDGLSGVELTENRIFQPIFSTRKVVTGVKVWDGATVVLGGLVSDNTVMIEDKVPFLGEAPVVGRLFRSNVKQRRMKNMLFFVTVKVIDPSGSRIHPEGQ